MRWGVLRTRRGIAIAAVAVLAVGGGIFAWHQLRQTKKAQPKQVTTGFVDSLSPTDRALYASTNITDASGKTDESKKPNAVHALDSAIGSAQDNTQKVKAYGQKAAFCYSQKDYACAAQNYEATYAITPNWDIAWDAAMAYEQAKNKPKALDYYKLAANGATDVDAGNGSPKTIIRDKIAELSK